MIKLRNGSLRTVIYNKDDLDLYIQAGWKVVEDKLTTVEKNEQGSPKRKPVKK